MREATYDDAVIIAKLLNDDQDRVWKLIKGLRYAALGDLVSLMKDVLQAESETGIRHRASRGDN